MNFRRSGEQSVPTIGAGDAERVSCVMCVCMEIWPGVRASARTRPIIHVVKDVRSAFGIACVCVCSRAMCVHVDDDGWPHFR